MMTTFSVLFTVPDTDLKIRGAGHPGLSLNKGGTVSLRASVWS